MTTHPTIKTKIGVFGIGLAAYWEQFEGLKVRLEGYQRYVEGRITDFGAEVVSAGLVDTPPAAQAAGDLFARETLICWSAMSAPMLLRPRSCPQCNGGVPR